MAKEVLAAQLRARLPGNWNLTIDEEDLFPESPTLDRKYLAVLNRLNRRPGLMFTSIFLVLAFGAKNVIGMDDCAGMHNRVLGLEAFAAGEMDKYLPGDVESRLFTVAKYMESHAVRCEQIMGSHPTTQQLAMQVDDGEFLSAIGAPTEARLHKYQNARYFTNIYFLVIQAQTKSISGLRHKWHPNLVGSEAYNRQKMLNLDRYLDRLGVQKSVSDLNFNERPSP